MQSSACAGGSLHSPPPDTKANEAQTRHEGIFVGFGDSRGTITQIEAGLVAEIRIPRAR